MKEQDDVFRKFQDSFSRLDGHFHILEQSVSVERQMEYFKYSEQTKNTHSPVTEDNYRLWADILADPQAPVDRVRQALVLLASSRIVKAYRILEDYISHPHAGVEDWAPLALMESRISLESEFLDEKQIFITTGLGGHNDCLRFFVVLQSRDKKVFLDYQRQVIARETEYYLQQAQCEIEKLEIDDIYVVLRILIPIRSNIKNILDKVVQECNEYGDFLYDEYTVTNVKELSRDEIMAIITKSKELKADN